MAKLFGFSIEDDDKKKKGIISPVAPNNEDGADSVSYTHLTLPTTVFV